MSFLLIANSSGTGGKLCVIRRNSMLPDSNGRNGKDGLDPVKTGNLEILTDFTARKDICFRFQLQLERFWVSFCDMGLMCLFDSLQALFFTYQRFQDFFKKNHKRIPPEEKLFELRGNL